MTQSFDEYFKTNYNGNLNGFNRLLIQEAFETGAQSRQVEIDELKQSLSEITDKCILRGQEIELLGWEIYNKNQIIEACLYLDEEGESDD